MEDLFGKFAKDKEYSYEEHMKITRHFSAISKLLDYFFQDIKKCKDVLDIATGTGIVPHYLKEKSKQFNILGTDKSEIMLELAKKKNNSIKFSNREISNFKDNSFDLITISYGIAWINFEETFKHIKKILRNKGKLLIIDDVNLNKPLFTKKNNYLLELALKRKKISLDKLKKRLLSNGFKIVKEKRLKLKTHEVYGLLAINLKKY